MTKTLLLEAADDCAELGDRYLQDAPSMGPTKERNYKRVASECFERAAALKKLAESQSAEPRAEPVIENPPQQHYRCSCPDCCTAFLVEGTQPFSLKAIYCRCGRTVEFVPGLRPQEKSGEQRCTCGSNPIYRPLEDRCPVHAKSVAPHSPYGEVLRDVYAEAAASWGTSGANEALERIKALTARYGNPTACPSCPDPGGCALPDGTFACRNSVKSNPPRDADGNPIKEGDLRWHLDPPV